jgi:hypothetical protein
VRHDGKETAEQPALPAPRTTAGQTRSEGRWWCRHPPAGVVVKLRLPPHQ